MKTMPLFIVSALAIGCGGFDPVGSYEGTATRSGNTSRMDSDVGADGTANVTRSNFNTSQTGAVVTVRRIDDSHLEVDIGDGCRVRVEQQPEPNEHNTQVVLSPEQRCRVQVEGFSGEAFLSGHVNFRKQDPPQIDVTLNANTQQGDPSRAGSVTLGYTYAFNGQRRAQ
jgi:hypothetical protein